MAKVVNKSVSPSLEDLSPPSSSWCSEEKKCSRERWRPRLTRQRARARRGALQERGAGASSRFPRAHQFVRSVFGGRRAQANVSDVRTHSPHLGLFSLCTCAVSGKSPKTVHNVYQFFFEIEVLKNATYRDAARWRRAEILKA